MPPAICLVEHVPLKEKNAVENTTLEKFALPQPGK